MGELPNPEICNLRFVQEKNAKLRKRSNVLQTTVGDVGF